jgi:PAS domain S-box-containing protein
MNEFPNGESESERMALRAENAELRQRIADLEARLAAAVSTASPEDGQENAQKQLAFLQTLIDVVPVPIFYKDATHRYLGCNSAFEVFLGRSKAEIVDRGVEDVAPGDLAAVYRAADMALLERGGTQVYETQVSDANGERRDVVFHKAVFDGEDGRSAGLIGIILDITDHKRFERELKLSKERVEFANRSMTEFLANMSHELRTPLNSIIGFSDVMRTETFGPIAQPQYREYVGNIHASGTHLLALISEILDVSKIEAGELALDVGPVDVPQLAVFCLDMVRERAERAELQVTSEIDPVLQTIQADELRVKQILLNLLSNAIKFTPGGGAVVLRIEPEQGNLIRFTVSDSGIGIPEDELARVVQPFVQGSTNPSHRQMGSGLGLSLARSLSELHGGTLEIASVLGEGTKVTVRLPRDQRSARA